MTHEYGVSLTTVRRALALLRAEGLTERRRGQLQIVRAREETTVRARGGDVLRARPATRQDQDEHGIPEGTVVLVISRADGSTVVRRADETAIEVPSETPGA